MCRSQGFLAESATLLNEDQKLCVLLNLYDSLLSDGGAAPEEQALMNRFMTAYGVSEGTLQPYEPRLNKTAILRLAAKSGTVGVAFLGLVNEAVQKAYKIGLYVRLLQF